MTSLPSSDFPGDTSPRREQGRLNPPSLARRAGISPLRVLAVVVSLGMLATLLPAQEPFTSVAVEVNKKMVKVFGGGGYKSLPSYGTGVLIAPNGYLLTVNNHILAWPSLRIHLYDGRQYD